MDGLLDGIPLSEFDFSSENKEEIEEEARLLLEARIHVMFDSLAPDPGAKR